MSFTHLHVHSEYSLLDGACRIEPMLDKIKSMGQTSCAITDHGVMYGVIDFYKAAKARGIKPIIGCEVYVAPRSRFDKVHGIDNILFFFAGIMTAIKILLSLFLRAGSTAFTQSPELIKIFLKNTTTESLRCQAVLRERFQEPCREGIMKKQKGLPFGIQAFSARITITLKFRTTVLTNS